MILRNIIFYLCLTPITIVYAITGLILFWTPYKFRYDLITSWSYVFINLAKYICGIRFQVSGLEHIPTKPVIVVSNHQSMWETIFFQILFPRQTWLLKKELLSIPFFGWGLSLLEPIAIDRKNSVESLKRFKQQGKAKLDANSWVIVFPEGTRTNSSQIKRFAKSAAMLSIDASTDVLPVAHNSASFWPKGFFFKSSGTIKVNIGPLVQPCSDVNELNTKLKANVQELLNQIYT